MAVSDQCQGETSRLRPRVGAGAFRELAAKHSTRGIYVSLDCMKHQHDVPPNSTKKSLPSDSFNGTREHQVREI
jgi:hypothetical protein